MSQDEDREQEIEIRDRNSIFHLEITIGHLEKLPYCKRTKAESAALP
jgi:hypothetical protein